MASGAGLSLNRVRSSVSAQAVLRFLQLGGGVDDAASAADRVVAPLLGILDVVPGPGDQVSQLVEPLQAAALLLGRVGQRPLLEEHRHEPADVGDRDVDARPGVPALDLGPARGELVRALPLAPAAEPTAVVEGLGAGAGEDLVAVPVGAHPPVERPVLVLGLGPLTTIGGEPLLPDVREGGPGPVGLGVAGGAAVDAPLPGVPLLLGEGEAERRQLDGLVDHPEAVLAAAVVVVDLVPLEVVAPVQSDRSFLLDLVGAGPEAAHVPGEGAGGTSQLGGAELVIGLEAAVGLGVPRAAGGDAGVGEVHAGGTEGATLGDGLGPALPAHGVLAGGRMQVAGVPVPAVAVPEAVVIELVRRRDERLGVGPDHAVVRQLGEHPTGRPSPDAVLLTRGLPVAHGGHQLAGRRGDVDPLQAVVDRHTAALGGGAHGGAVARVANPAAPLGEVQLLQPRHQAELGEQLADGVAGQQLDGVLHRRLGGAVEQHDDDGGVCRYGQGVAHQPAGLEGVRVGVLAPDRDESDLVTQPVTGGRPVQQQRLEVQRLEVGDGRQGAELVRRGLDVLLQLLGAGGTDPEDDAGQRLGWQPALEQGGDAAVGAVGAAVHWCLREIPRADPGCGAPCARFFVSQSTRLHVCAGTSTKRRRRQLVGQRVEPVERSPVSR
ncbi:hypothetical protein [Modestobacter roseus]|uniref:hypothetical protein n=1 Tax=Modestobacter roseus TaxID=1181884 RepID=UPI001295CFA6|nr:hypothetical protein [Modestobacter roseus]